MENLVQLPQKFLPFSLVVLFVVIGMVVTPTRAFGHGGGGPPFVLINEKYAATNPLFLGATSEKGLTLPQDIAPTTYTVNSPLMLRVDITQLGIDPGIAESMRFFWRFTRGDNFSIPVDNELQGTSAKKIFSQIGSYLITLTSQLPDQDPILLDTIQVNILPTTTYSLPKSSVMVLTSLRTNSSTSFENTSSGTRYLWDFGENSIVTGKTIRKVFNEEYFYSPLYARVIDENGFVTDTGITIVGDKGQLAFSLINQGADPKSLLVKQNSNNHVLLAIISVISFFIAILLLLRFKKNIIRR